MARLNTYATDDAPDASDKVIGSDSTGTITKNYPLGNIASWLKSSGATAVLGQNNFTFQTVADPQVGRLPGTFSLPVIGGDGTPFDAITALKFSQQSDTGQNIADFIASTVGSRVILGQLDNLNAFGVYLLESFTQDPAAPTFYDAVLTFVGGNGTLIGGSPYGMATYSSTQTDGGAWGSITGTVTDQTDLVTYVTSERLNYPVQSPNGTSFIIVAGNDGTLAAIPPNSTAPSITTLPTISGTLNVAEILTATAGTTSGVPTPTRVLQWQRSDNGTTGWADISGATGTTYFLGFNDEDKYIRVTQTEENILGTATANSVSTGQIQPATILLLDLYPNAAAAYSLRKLRILYSGDAIVVRRASDNATQSIGFLINGELDTASLESFCAGTDGFVTTWYDQSGNSKDAIQTTSSKQPKIVSSGSIITENAKPTIQWVDTVDALVATTSVSISNDLTAIAVNAANTNGSQSSNGAIAQYNVDSFSHISVGYRDGGYFTRLYKGGLVNELNGYDFSSTSLNLVFDYIDYTNISNQIYVDNVIRIDLNAGRSNVTANSLISIGNRGSNDLSPQAAISEMIFYESDQTSNRSGIQTNINNFYNIY